MLVACLFQRPDIALAQPAEGTPRVIGVLTSIDLVSLPVLIDGLRQLGYEDGKGARILLRSTKGDYSRLPALARELVDAKVDLLLAFSTPAAQAAVNATRTIPAVFAGVGDPIGSGLVGSMARPGGNITGRSFSSTNSTRNGSSCSSGPCRASRRWTFSWYGTLQRRRAS